jgi:hypothetical protein
MKAIYTAKLKEIQKQKPHEILGVSEKANDQEIANAKKGLSREWHPDKVKKKTLDSIENAEYLECIDIATDIMRIINGAAATLANNNQERKTQESYTDIEQDSKPPKRKFQTMYENLSISPFFHLGNITDEFLDKINLPQVNAEKIKQFIDELHQKTPRGRHIVEIRFRGSFSDEINHILTQYNEDVLKTGYTSLRWGVSNDAMTYRINMQKITLFKHTPSETLRLTDSEQTSLILPHKTEHFESVYASRNNFEESLKQFTKFIYARHIVNNAFIAEPFKSSEEFDQLMWALEELRRQENYVYELYYQRQGMPVDSLVMISYLGGSAPREAFFNAIAALISMRVLISNAEIISAAIENIQHVIQCQENDDGILSRVIGNGLQLMGIFLNKRTQSLTVKERYHSIGETPKKLELDKIALFSEEQRKIFQALDEKYFKNTSLSLQNFTSKIKEAIKKTVELFDRALIKDNYLKADLLYNTIKLVDEYINHFSNRNNLDDTVCHDLKKAARITILDFKAPSIFIDAYTAFFHEINREFNHCMRDYMSGKNSVDKKIKNQLDEIFTMLNSLQEKYPLSFSKAFNELINKLNQVISACEKLGDPNIGLQLKNFANSVVTLRGIMGISLHNGLQHQLKDLQLTLSDTDESRPQISGRLSQ